MLRWNLNGWQFQWENNEDRLGACSHRAKTIFLSRPYTSTSPEAHVRDTILHEIGHALAPPDAGHGPAWEAWAKTVGATPMAVAPPPVQEVFDADIAYQLTCGNCYEEGEATLMLAEPAPSNF